MSAVPCGPGEEGAISALAQVLRWSEPPGPAVSCLEARYADVLGARLGEVLAAICQEDPVAGADLLQRVDAASEGELRAALLAPETSRRLVTRLHSPADVKEHLRSVFAGAGRPQPSAPARLGCDIPLVEQPAGDARLAPVARHAEHAFGLLAHGCPPAAAFVARVTRRLVLRIDDMRDGFASNSPQGLVGQAVLTNAHLPLVDDVVMAEALVHESIHGFVGMSEAVGLAGRRPQERWLADERFYEGFSCTVSPWTGKRLDLPTYLHACFVWWGLLHLWASVAGAGAFEERRVRSRLARAARGFVDGALVQQLLPHRAAIHPQLLGCCEAMADEVDALLADTGMDRLLQRIEEVEGSAR